MTEFITQNWEYLLLGFFIIEKIVKLTSWTWDDLLVDGVKAGFNSWRNRGKNIAI